MQSKCEFSFYWQNRWRTPASNSFFEQRLQETNIVANSVVLDQQKKRKMFWTWTKLQRGGKEAWPKRWNDVESALSPYAQRPHPQHHHSVFVPLTQWVWQLTIRRYRLRLQFFSVQSPPWFSVGQQRRARMDRQMDGWKETTHYHTLGTDGNLQAAWRQEHAQPPVAMGTRVHGELNGHRRLLPLPRFEHSWIDMSACPRGEAEREETFPACILHCLCEAKHGTSICTELVSTGERKNKEIFFFSKDVDVLKSIRDINVELTHWQCCKDNTGMSALIPSSVSTTWMSCPNVLISYCKNPLLVSVDTELDHILSVTICQECSV